MKSIRHSLLLLPAFLLVPALASAEESCFRMKDKTTSARLMVDMPDGDGKLIAVEDGTIQDAEQGYYTSWESEITGTRKGSQAKVKAEITIENDKQVEQQVWKIEKGAIVTDRGRFEAVSCDEFDKEDQQGDGKSEEKSEDKSDKGSTFDNVPDHASDDITRGHCEDSEDVIFTCEVNDDDVVSICASKNRKQVSYHYGPVVAPELDYPDDKAGSAKRFMIHSIGYSGGYDTGLGFKTGPYTYVVHERMLSRGANDPGKDMEGGVTLYKGMKVAKELTCRSLGDAGLGLNQLMDAVPEVPFFDEEGLVQ